MTNIYVKQITRADIDEALLRVESGEATKDDANMLRAYIHKLSNGDVGVASFSVANNVLQSEA